MNQIGSAITSLAELIVGKMLKVLAKGTIKYLGREAVEEIAREVMRDEFGKLPLSQFMYSPKLSFEVAIQDVFAIIGNDNRFQVTEDKRVLLIQSPQTEHLISPLLSQNDDHRRQLARDEVVQLRYRIEERKRIMDSRGE